jgi:hypothetical protein
MKVTNELGLPQAFINALNLEKHNEKGCYSATTLLKGACETVLADRHFDEIEIDVADCVWQIWGTAVHLIFERAGIEGFTEEKFSVPVSNSKVTGRVDLYDLENETVYDWKTASTWKVQFNDFSDWDKQGLIYAWLMKQNGLKVKEIKFVALLKDHSKSKARKDFEYPQKPVVVHTVKVTEEALKEIEAFINLKVRQFEVAETLVDEKLTPCTKEERWATEDKWAIMKAGRKTALKVCDSEEEAKDYIKNNFINGRGGEISIEHRAGESKKCVDGYCACRNFCPFYKSLNK